MFASKRINAVAVCLSLVTAAPLLSNQPEDRKEAPPSNVTPATKTEPEGPMLHIRPQTQTVRPGAEVELKLYVSNVEDLRGYQLALKTRDESNGSLAIIDIAIDDANPEYVFAVDLGTSQEAIRQPSLERGMALSARFQGGVAVQKGYLATFKIRAPRLAGTLDVELDKPRSMLLNSASEHITFTPVAAQIVVADGPAATK